jgi:hypothetical protein
MGPELAASTLIPVQGGLHLLNIRSQSRGHTRTLSSAYGNRQTSPMGPWSNGKSGRALIATLIGSGSDTGFPAGTGVHAFSILGFRLSAVAGLCGCHAVLIFVCRPGSAAIRVIASRRLPVVAYFATRCGGPALCKRVDRKAKACNCNKSFHDFPLTAARRR